MSTKQVIKAQKFRFYPTKSQEELLAKTFGAVRFFWNKRVESFNNYEFDINEDTYKTFTKDELINFANMILEFAEKTS